MSVIWENFEGSALISTLDSLNKDPVVGISVYESSSNNPCSEGAIFLELPLQVFHPGNSISGAERPDGRPYARYLYCSLPIGSILGRPGGRKTSTVDRAIHEARRGVVKLPRPSLMGWDWQSSKHTVQM